MAYELVSGVPWAEVEPLPPSHKACPAKRGRPPVSVRAALCGIMFVLKSGIPWEMLPLEINCGSGMTCFRRLRDRQKAGVWKRLHAVLLSKLNKADQMDWIRASVDSIIVRAKGAKEEAKKARRLACRLWTEDVRAPSITRRYTGTGRRLPLCSLPRT